MIYKQWIIELLERINSEKFLYRIYISLRNYVRESEGRA